MNRRQLLRSAAALPMAGAAFSAAAAQQKQIKITQLQIKITQLETDVRKQPPGTPTYDAIHTLGVDSGSATNLNMLLAMPNAIYMESGGARKLVNGEMLGPEEPGMSSEPKG